VGIFIATFDTSLTGNASVPISFGIGDVDVSIDWGDGNTEAVTSNGTVTHTYATAGTYTVTISGTALEIDASPGPNFALIGVDSWNNVMGLFQVYVGSPYLTYVPATLPTTIGTTSSMFIGATIFNGDITGWDTSAVADMSGMFFNAAAFNQNIGGWNTSSVEGMNYMFKGAAAFNQNIGAWNTASVFNMSFMFQNAAAFNQPLADWSTGNVTDMTSMFDNATVFDQDISLWCVYQILSLPSDFNTSGVLTPAYFPVWGTCPVIIPFPLVLYGNGYNAFSATQVAPYPLTLSR
jgi:hypothetical protein